MSVRSFLKNNLPQWLRLFLKRIYIRVTSPTTKMPKITSHNNLERLWFFKNVKEYLWVNRMSGVYCEFGCHEITTFRYALNEMGDRAHPLDIYHFYAFDSFEGMPEPDGIDKQKIWRKGMNHTSEEYFQKVCKLDMDRITTVKGFYSESLPDFHWNSKDKIVFSYIDCDYYSSTVDVLAFLEGKLVHGGIIAFDDWNCYYGDPERGQKKAFQEFSERLKEKYQFEPYLPISWGGYSFIVHEKDKKGKEIV